MLEAALAGRAGVGGRARRTHIFVKTITSIHMAISRGTLPIFKKCMIYLGGQGQGTATQAVVCVRPIIGVDRQRE